MTAFRQSVEAMIPALRRYARALARDADVADDLVQDTLVRALRSERLFRAGDAGGRATFGAAAGHAGRIELSRGRRNSGRADRHRDVPPRPRARPCQGVPRRRATRAAQGEVMGKTANVRKIAVRNSTKKRQWQ